MVPSRVGDEGTVQDLDRYPFRYGERVRVTAISESGRMVEVESVERAGLTGKMPIAIIQVVR